MSLELRNGEPTLDLDRLPPSEVLKIGYRAIDLSVDRGLLELDDSLIASRRRIFDASINTWIPEFAIFLGKLGARIEQVSAGSDALTASLKAEKLAREAETANAGLNREKNIPSTARAHAITVKILQRIGLKKPTE